MNKKQKDPLESWQVLIPLLRQLLEQGVCKIPEGKPLSEAGEKLCRILSGVAAPGVVGEESTAEESPSRWITAQPLLELRRRVTNDNEAIASLLASKEEVRQYWVKIIAARVKEAGQMKDRKPLFQMISQLDGAASWIESNLSAAGLSPTPLASLERDLLGTVAESAQATPLLCRVLAGAAWLKFFQKRPLSAMHAVDMTGERPDLNWCKGRLLELPQSDSDAWRKTNTSITKSFLLSGTIKMEADDENGDTMTWVLETPWAFLLASLVYAQDSWDAEQRGGILLELPAGQQAFSPNQIQVLVAGSEGEEALCGSLAELVLKFMESHSMHLFPMTPKKNELDQLLRDAVKALLVRKVWRYYEGLSGQQGYYRIDPDFADSCYRRLGSKIFQRYGKNIWQRFRLLAEQWGQEVRISGMRSMTKNRLQGVTV